MHTLTSSIPVNETELCNPEHGTPLSRERPVEHDTPLSRERPVEHETVRT